jgi:hypothetical protein
MEADGENQFLTAEYTENTEGRAAEAVATKGTEGAKMFEVVILSAAKDPSGATKRNWSSRFPLDPSHGSG